VLGSIRIDVSFANHTVGAVDRCPHAQLDSLVAHDVIDTDRIANDELVALVFTLLDDLDGFQPHLSCHFPRTRDENLKCHDLNLLCEPKSLKVKCTLLGGSEKYLRGERPMGTSDRGARVASGRNGGRKISGAQRGKYAPAVQTACDPWRRSLPRIFWENHPTTLHSQGPEPTRARTNTALANSP
jgi:hypothetical protein